MSKWESKDSIQFGGINFPLEHIEITVSETGEEQASETVRWNESLQELRNWYVEFTSALTQVGNALFKAIQSAWSLTWEIVMSTLKPRHDSKQTRAYYRVKARTQHRRKFQVHAHRWYRGRGRG